ncbi:MAG: hypothetical protein V3S68_05225, partial [Dehalococcoidia bacterium]
MANFFFELTNPDMRRLQDKLNAKQRAEELDSIGATNPEPSRQPPTPVSGPSPVPTPTPQPTDGRPKEVVLSPEILESPNSEQLLQELADRGVTGVREGGGPIGRGGGRALQAVGIGSDVVSAPFQFAGAVGKSVIEEAGAGLTGIPVAIPGAGGVQRSQPRPRVPTIPKGFTQSPYKNIEQFRELPLAAQLLFEVAFDPLFIFGGIKSAVIGAAAARKTTQATLNIPLLRRILDHRVGEAGAGQFTVRQVKTISDELVTAAQRTTLDAEGFERLATELIEKAKAQRAEGPAGGQLPLQERVRRGRQAPFEPDEADDLFDNLFAREGDLDEAAAVREFESELVETNPELTFSEVELAEIELFEVQAIAEGQEAGLKVIRPPKNSKLGFAANEGFSGMSDDTLRQLAEHEGLDPSKVDWYDGIDKKLIKQFRQEPPLSTARARNQQGKNAVRLAKDKLDTAKAAEPQMAPGTSVQGGFAGDLAPPAQQTGFNM